MPTHRTFCRNCSAACGLIIETEANRVVSIVGDRAHPLTAGYMCIKGASSADWQNGEDRLTTALRRGGDGQFTAIETETALDEIQARLDDVLAQHGPRSLALYYGTGSKKNNLGSMALTAWLRAVGSPYLYSSSTLDQSAKWVTRSRMGVFTAGRPTLVEADVILVAGCNPNVSHIGSPLQPFSGVSAGRSIREARAAGAKLIVIDPRRTEFAQQADLHLAVLPGEDVSLFAGMIHVILANGWEDKAFCQRFVTSLDVLRERVRDYPPEYAAAKAGVAEEDLIAAARLFAQARRPTAGSGTGPNMSARSNLAEHLLEALNAICGGYRRAGDLLQNTGAFSPRHSIREGVSPPQRTWESGPKLWTEDSGLVGGEFPSSRLPREILDGGLKALIVVGGNPLTALGQPELTRRAFAELDLLVTVDPRMTQTAAVSDYVIPCTLPYERHDSSHFSDSFFMEPFAQVATPILSPPPGVQHDWEIFWGLARRAGVPLTFTERRWGGVGTISYPIDMDERPSSEALMRMICNAEGLTYDDFADHPEGLRPDRDPLVVQPAESDDGARLDVCPPDVAEHLTAALTDPPSTGFAYRLAVRRMIETMNSAFRDAGRTRRRWPRNPAFMNPADMAREGLQPGDAIEIASADGAIVGEVRPDSRLRPGVISMSHQWGELFAEDDPSGETGGFTGRLVSLERDLETINYMPRQSGIPVNVRTSGFSFEERS